MNLCSFIIHILFGKVVVYKHECFCLNMLHLDKAVFCCILCGILAIYYMSVYVTVSIVIAFLLFLYYISKANWSRVNVRRLTLSTLFRKFLVSFRTWTDSSLISIMKSSQQIRSDVHRSRANGVSAYAAASKLTVMETPRRSYIHYRLDRENFEDSRRNSFSAYSSSDSMHSNTRSNNRGHQLLHQTSSRYSGDLSFSPKGSPWGKSVSPRLRSHGSGVKTVQTVAGPLLASTRFNISKNLE